MDQVTVYSVCLAAVLAVVGGYEKWRLDRINRRIDAEIARRRSWEQRQAR